MNKTKRDICLTALVAGLYWLTQSTVRDWELILHDKFVEFLVRTADSLPNGYESPIIINILTIGLSILSASFLTILLFLLFGVIGARFLASPQKRACILFLALWGSAYRFNLHCVVSGDPVLGILAPCIDVITPWSALIGFSIARRMWKTEPKDGQLSSESAPCASSEEVSS